MGKAFQKTWEFFEKRTKEQQARLLLTKATDNIIHRINKLIVFKFSEGNYEVINEESLVCKFFDTEDECIDYCLDVYPNSFKNEQLNLFDTE